MITHSIGDHLTYLVRRYDCAKEFCLKHPVVTTWEKLPSSLKDSGKSSGNNFFVLVALVVVSKIAPFPLVKPKAGTESEQS